jgi:hypothetical protein
MYAVVLGDDHQVITLTAEDARQLEPDSARGARHQRRFVLRHQVELPGLDCDETRTYRCCHSC